MSNLWFFRLKKAEQQRRRSSGEQSVGSHHSVRSAGSLPDGDKPETVCGSAEAHWMGQSSGGSLVRLVGGRRAEQQSGPAGSETERQSRPSQNFHYEYSEAERAAASAASNRRHADRDSQRERLEKSARNKESSSKEKSTTTTSNQGGLFNRAKLGELNLRSTHKRPFSQLLANSNNNNNHHHHQAAKQTALDKQNPSTQEPLGPLPALVAEASGPEAASVPVGWASESASQPAGGQRCWPASVATATAAAAARAELPPGEMGAGRKQVVPLVNIIRSESIVSGPIASWPETALDEGPPAEQPAVQEQHRKGPAGTIAAFVAADKMQECQRGQLVGELGGQRKQLVSELAGGQRVASRLVRQESGPEVAQWRARQPGEKASVCGQTGLLLGRPEGSLRSPLQQQAAPHSLLSSGKVPPIDERLLDPNQSRAAGLSMADSMDNLAALIPR